MATQYEHGAYWQMLGSGTRDDDGNICFAIDFLPGFTFQIRESNCAPDAAPFTAC